MTSDPLIHENDKKKHGVTKTCVMLKSKNKGRNNFNESQPYSLGNFTKKELI